MFLAESGLSHFSQVISILRINSIVLLISFLDSVLEVLYSYEYNSASFMSIVPLKT